ncbi:Peroxiredoxin [Trichinella pseudospiralis]|uniref:thioredoxin-dependent peroxiredoxin n=1 Tax=Trichinella pseudospiralis TaxID=6337 RepID=A0A0V1IY13_TRIPS|nr:Peroxiredoxin [Trichinella pseudospiralis]KRZ27528.1 Peroxiredoxin [Trichinella pseudospiralis]
MKMRSLNLPISKNQFYFVPMLSTFRSKNRPYVGEPAPNFSTVAVVDGRIVNVKLTDYRGSYLVLFFYPRDFDSSCSSEIINFHENVKNFQKIGCKIAACSTDSEYCHLAWIQSPRCENGLGKLDFPLFADPVHIISKLYGVYQEEQGFCLRAIFIIDDNGILRQMCINDIHVHCSVDETFRTVQALQFVSTCEKGERNKK